MKMILETLTPVFIGSGESIEPYEYFIKDRFYRINLPKFILSLDKANKEEFLKISSSDMIKTRNFIKEMVDTSKVQEYSMEIDSDVLEVYEDKKNDPNNQLSIQTFIKTSSRPFIPGSSVKGAIRTALLYSMTTKPLPESGNIEKDVFEYKNPQDDPFRVLKISDSLPLSFDDMKIYNVKTFSKKDRFSASGYNMMFEGTKSYYFDRASVASHDIWIDENLKKKSEFIDINIKKIISSCNEFYGMVINKELEFYGSSKTSYAYEKYEQLAKDMGSLKNENSFILRLGWGSGYNSVTINLAKERPDTKISRRLIKGEFPPGWVKVKIMEGK